MTPPSRTPPSLPSRARPIVVEVAPTRPWGTASRPWGRPSGPRGHVDDLPPPAPGTIPCEGAVLPWDRLAVVGMVAPPPTVELGVAMPLYRVDATDDVPAELRGVYALGYPVAAGLRVRVAWATEPPDHAATPFAYPPPRTHGPEAARGARHDPRVGAPIAELPGVLYDDWTPGDGRVVAVIRASTWKRLRSIGVTPPWAFRAIGVMPSGARCRVALVDRAAFHAWRRALGWESLATVRGYLRDPAWHDDATTRAHVERVRRLAFDVLPQYTRDRSAVKALTVLTSPPGEHRERAIAALNAPKWAPEAAGLLDTMRAWLQGGPAIPPGLDRNPFVPRGAAGGGDDRDTEGDDG